MRERDAKCSNDGDSRFHDDDDDASYIDDWPMSDDDDDDSDERLVYDLVRWRDVDDDNRLDDSMVQMGVPRWAMRRSGAVLAWPQDSLPRLPHHRPLLLPRIDV